MDRRKRIVYPRTMDTQTVYLQNVITKPNIEVGAYTMYHDVVHDPRGFETNNVLYQYPVNEDKLRIGKFCSIACGAKFLFTSANHTLRSLSTYPFPIFFEQWGLDARDIRSAWDNRGDIVVGNDVWIGFEAVILSGLAASSMQAPYPSPRRKRQVSSISLHLLFRPNPLRWASVEFLRRTLAQRPVFGLLAGTRSAVSGKPHKPPTRARQAVTGILAALSTCVFNKIGIFLPRGVLIQFLQLLVIVLLECRLNRSDGESQIAVALMTILCCDHRRFCDEQPAFFERPDVFAYGVWTQPNRFSDLSVARPALERLAILAKQQVGIDRNFRCAQPQ